MQYLEALNGEQVSAEVREILGGLKKKIGMVPNTFAIAAHSPTALKAILTYEEILRKGAFNPKEREAIALAVSQENDCRYCLAAHTAAGKMLGFSEGETLALRTAEIDDRKLQVLTELAKELVVTRGAPSRERTEKFFGVGYGKPALVELVGLVALRVFYNYLNVLAGTTLDFPPAPELVERMAA